MEKSTLDFEELENVKTKDLVNGGGVLLDIEGRDISLKTAKDGHVSYHFSILTFRHSH